MFYNTENFFDCKDDSLKDDNEFLPESMRAWHYGRFKQKAANISKAIINSGGGAIPAIVGLAEVENNYVMDYLTKYSPLKQLGYRYVMTNSPDERGIDVAFMYQREQFRLISNTTRQFDTASFRYKPTRDMLHCCGCLYTEDTIDFIVVHLPSKRGGDPNSEKARYMIMNKIKEYTDSIAKIRRNSNIVIMGDFNTSPDNKTLNLLFNTGNYVLLSSEFTGKTNLGSYKYKGIWQTIDHIIINKTMFDCYKNIRCRTMEIVADDYMLQKDEKFMGKKPFRTYNGFKYIGGFSDHLPIKAVIYY